MRASNLVNLGSMILMLGVGAGAPAEEAAVLPVGTPAVAEAEAPPADAEVVSEPTQTAEVAPASSELAEPPAAEALAPAALAETAASEPKTGSAETAASEPETGSVETAASEPETGSAETAASEPETGSAETAASEPETGSAETAAPEPETGSAETAASEPETGSAETAAPEPKTGSAETAASEPKTGSAETAASEPKTGSAEDGPPEAPELGSMGYDSQGRPGRIHIVRPGDTLWDISDAYLGTPWVWPSIWQDNREIENPHLIYPGDRIWITPTEMRRVSAEEAEALLAGAPAALEQETGSELEPEFAAPAPQVVREERPTYFVSDREMVGLIGADTVEASASIVSAAVPRLMLSQGDRVWVGLGEDEVEAGDQFTIFRVQEKVYDPETGRMLGYHVHILGWAEILEPHAESSLAEIRESAIDMVKGDQIMARRPQVREIAIQPSPEAVEGQISFLAGQRTLVGTMEYVYLNRGTLDGLEVGSPLEVYRKGYMAREEVRGARVQVPDRVVADLLVVKAQTEASVALVRHTEEELALGDHFRGARQ